jgi:rhodanese-related sulfurtransferase
MESVSRRSRTAARVARTARVPRRRAFAVVAVAVALGLVAACGSDDPDDGGQVGTASAVTATAGEAGGMSTVAEAFTVIDVDGLDEAIDEVPDLQVVDVRTAEEVATGTIPGSVNIPHDVIDAGDTGALDLDAPIAVICRSGSRATVAGEALVAAGATDVRVVRPGGVTTWAEAGYPTVVP